MRYVCEASRFRIVPFWTTSECPRERAYDETPILDRAISTLSQSLLGGFRTSFPIDIGPRNKGKKKLTSRLPLVCSLRNG
jgi:hypothetical protein